MCGENYFDLHQSLSLLSEVILENKIDQHDKIVQLKTDIKTISKDIQDRLDAIANLKEAESNGLGLDNLALMDVISYMRAHFTTDDPEKITQQIDRKKERLAELILQHAKLDQDLRNNPTLLEQEEFEILDPITFDDITDFGDRKIKINGVWYSKNSAIQYFLSQLLRIYRNWDENKFGALYNNSMLWDLFDDVYHQAVSGSLVKKLFTQYNIPLSEISQFGPIPQFELNAFNNRTPTLASLLRAEYLESEPNRKKTMTQRVMNKYKFYNIEI